MEVIQDKKPILNFALKALSSKAAGKPSQHVGATCWDGLTWMLRALPTCCRSRQYFANIFIVFRGWCSLTCQTVPTCCANVGTVCPRLYYFILLQKKKILKTRFLVKFCCEVKCPAPARYTEWVPFHHKMA